MTSAALFAVAMKYLPQELIGTGVGIANFGQMSAGIIAPTIFGYLIQVFRSYSLVFAFVIAVTTIALIVGLTMNTGKYRERSADARAAS
jgi:MFS family permease